VPVGGGLVVQAGDLECIQHGNERGMCRRKPRPTVAAARGLFL
jgi:hypothetical protein